MNDGGATRRPYSVAAAYAGSHHSGLSSPMPCAQWRMLSRVASVHQGSTDSSTGRPTSSRSAARLSSVISEKRGEGSGMVGSCRTRSTWPRILETAPACFSPPKRTEIFPMKIAVVGAGPAGLVFSLLMKRRRARDEIVVIEQNPRDATFGFGVVFSRGALEIVARDEPALHGLLAAAMESWPIQR